MSIKTIIQIIIFITSIIPSLFIVRGSYTYMTSGGDSGKKDSAQLTLTNSLIPFIILDGIEVFVVFFVPSIDVLSIVLLILTNFVFILFFILYLYMLLWTLVLYLEKRSQIARKRKNDEFDIVLYYNREDETDVMQLADRLQKEGILPWLYLFKESQPEQLLKSAPTTQKPREIKAAGACIGREGTGPWQRPDIEALLRKFVVEERPVFPILLPNAPQKPLLPLFLQSVIWIDLREVKQWKDFRSEKSYSMKLLITGIGKKGVVTIQSSSPSELAGQEIIEALDNPNYNQLAQLAKAIITLIEASDTTLIEAETFQPGTLWEIVLPSLGLQLPTNKALFFLRQKELTISQRERLVELKNDRETSLIFVVDYLTGLERPQFIDSRVVWFRPEHLSEILRTRDIVAWLGRLIASEVEYFEGLIPYRSGGSAQIFYGRTYELEQLVGGTVQGGVIIGAHGSGKTSLLDQLNKRLKTQDSHTIGNRYTYHSSYFRPFFEESLHSLGLAIPDELTTETWASTLRTYHVQGKCPVLLIDEVDQLIAQDTIEGFALGREMRALQYDGYCKFYLAGGRRLQKVVQLEGSPFRNFAQEVILKGLEKSAAFQLIQTPMLKIGFTVSDLQAARIYQGTAGVAILIQEYCKYLLLRHRQDRTATITDAVVEKVEQIPEYLNFVFHYYEYAQTANTMAVTLIVGQLGQTDRLNILHTFNKYGVMIDWKHLDEYIEFLTLFDILNEFKPGSYRISSVYYRKAIEARIHNSDAFLISQLERSKKG